MSEIWSLSTYLSASSVVYITGAWLQMLYDYMYLYIIVKSAYDIFVTDMRTEIEVTDAETKTNLLNNKELSKNETIS